MDRLFKVEVLRGMLLDENEEYEVLEDKATSHMRCYVGHRLVFKELPTGKLYETTYRVRADEDRVVDAFEGLDEVMCYEVEPYEETVIKYRTVVPF